MRKKLLSILALMLFVVTGTWAQDPTTYKVTMKEGAKDASNWTITPTAATTTGVAEEQTVTLTYNGRLNVKSVKALTTGGAWAQGKLIYEKDFASDASYPFYLDNAAASGASATVTDGLLVLTNPKVQATNWDVQPEIGRLTSAITQGNTYRVVMQYKTNVAGSVTFALGSQQDWNNADWRGQTITISDEFQTCEAYFNNYPYSIAESHILLQFGELVGTITIKKVEVYELYPFPITWDTTTKTATIAEMPAGNVLVTPEYYPGMLTFGSNAIEGGKLEVVGLGLGTTSFTPPSGWNQNSTKLASSHFEGFKGVTEEEAKAWPGVPATGLVALYYNYDETEQKWDMIYFEDGAFDAIYKGEPQQLATIYNLSTSNFSVFYTTGMQMPAGFEKDDDGNIYVAAGTQFTITATPAEGYHLVSWSDDATITDLERTITMGENDTTLTATFSNEYDITFNALNANTIEGENGKGTVTVKTGDAEAVDKTADIDAEHKLKAVKMGTEVKLKANDGYKFNGSESQVTIGDGTQTFNVYPTQATYNYCFNEMIYPADKIGMDGTISSIGFHYTGDNVLNRNVVVYMKHTTKSSFASATDWETLTASDIVFTGTLTSEAVEQWVTLTLDTPFEYDGTSNLLIAFDDNTGTWSSRYWYYTTGAENCCMTYYNDDTNADPYNPPTASGRHATLPNLQLAIAPSALVLEDELSFQMPANDTLVSYTLVRDLAVKTSVNIIIGEGDDAVILTKDSRLRIALDDNNSYQPVSALSCSLTDSIENNEEIAMDDFADAKLIPQFYLKGENDTWTLVTSLDPQTGLPSNLQPGQVYAITLAADEGSAYDGETAPSFTITLFEGYEMEIAAGEYATFYKDEALYIEDEDAVIYTISSIEGDKAVLSDAISVAPAETPLLIFNAGSEKKNFVIIPAEEGTEADDVEATPEFKGTLVAKQMDGSSDAVDYYVCNKHDFVWVKSAGTIAANRCWIELNYATARALQIVFSGDATGVEGLKNSRIEELNIYDLNGRKLDKMPTRKGVYIMNGKKVVIK